MKRFYLRAIVVVLFIGIGLCDDQSSAPPRLANGIPIEGTVQEAIVEGLVIKIDKGTKTYPWRYLSAGTRYRYERTISTSSASGKTNTVVRTAE